jgi:hypothetical protein
MRLPGPAFLPIVALTFAGFLLSACNTTTDSASANAPGAPPPAKSGLFGLFGPKHPNAGIITVHGDDVITTVMLLRQGYCPPVQIRPGTESFMVYERNHDNDPAHVRYLASLGETARECHATAAGDGLTVKLGVTGRLTAGPKGGEGTASLPLRVAVVKQHGGTVLFSKAYKVPVTVRAPQYFGNFAQVIDDIAFKITPADRDLIIYVGYDEGKPKPKTPPEPAYPGY